jgi:addiction module HigA family antidote
MIPTKRAPTHPGVILLEEFLKPNGMTQVDLAKKLGIPLQRINTMINGKRACTAETALLLAKEFGNSPEFWMNLQSAFDLYEARTLMHTIKERGEYANRV